MDYLRLLCFLMTVYLIKATSTDVTYVDISNVTATKPHMLNCSDSNEPGRFFKWTYSGPMGTNSTNQSNVFYIYSVRVGNYSCEIKGTALRLYKAINLVPPKIKHKGQSITFIEGETNKILECSSPSYPTPMFTWTYTSAQNEHVLSTLENNQYKIADDGMGNSVLTLTVIRDQDRGHYACMAENHAGKSTTTILVRVHPRLAPVWPFLGIVCEVLIVAIIVIVVRRKSANPEKELARPFNESSDSSSEDAGDSTVRQRNRN